MQNVQGKPVKRRRRNHPLRAVRRTVFLLFCFAFSIAVGFALFVGAAFQPPDEGGELAVIEIAPGSSSSHISDILEQEGLIRNGRVFLLYLRMENEGTRFQAGQYEIRRGMNFDEIIEKLNSGDVIAQELQRVTIPEGFTITQIGQRLASLEIMDEDTWYSELASFNTNSTLARAHPDDNEHILYRLEGYIFPETYDFPASWGPDEIVARMISEFDRKVNLLPGDWREILEERGWTVHEWVTIASLIEREAAVASERSIIASVIANRLDTGMLLQIDATIQYLFGESRDVVLLDDLEIDSPYNTYKFAGLPPGPIASPSLSSLRAALYPEDTSYLFYVTKKDGSREHWFAQTHEEHIRNRNR